MGKLGLPFHRYYPLGSRFGVREGFWLGCDESCSSRTRKMYNTASFYTQFRLSSIPENDPKNARVKKFCFICFPKGDTDSTDGAQDDFRGYEDEHFLFS